MTKPGTRFYKRQPQIRILKRLMRCVDDPRELDGWIRHAPHFYESPVGLLQTFCGDCTPAYREQMTGLGRCFLTQPNP